MQRHCISHRVTDETARYVEFIVERFFKWQKRQYQIGGFTNFENAFLSPCPDRRTDIMNGADTALFQTTFERDVKIRGVDAHKHIRLKFAETSGQIFADFQ